MGSDRPDHDDINVCGIITNDDVFWVCLPHSYAGAPRRSDPAAV